MTTQANYDRKLLESYAKLDSAGRSYVDGMISTWLAASRVYATPDPLPRPAEKPTA